MAPRAQRRFRAMLERVRLWLVGLLVTSLSFAAARARAEEHVVRVSMANGSPLEPMLYATLRELAARLGLRLVDGATGVEDAWSSVRLSPSSDGGMDIMVAGEKMEPPVHRHVGPSESDEMQRETIAHVVLGILEPRLDAERRRREDEPAPKLEPTPESKPEPDRADANESSQPRDGAALHSVRPRASVATGPMWLAPDRLAAHTNVALGVISDRALEPSLALSLGVGALRAVQRRGLSARLTVASARLRPSVTPLRSRRFALELALPLGCDLAFFRLRGAPRAARGEDGRIRVDPVLGPALTGYLRVARAFDLTLTGGADFDLKPRRWSFSEDGNERRLHALERVRPYAMLGLAWTREVPAGSAP